MGKVTSMNWARKHKDSIGHHDANGDSAVVQTHRLNGVPCTKPYLILGLNVEDEEDGKALAEEVFALLAARRNAKETK